jgi:hypothetical protein
MLSSVKPACCFGLLLLIFFPSFTGCSKEAVKPSEDDIQIKAVLAFVNRLKQTYEAKDQPGLMALISPDSALISSLPPILVRDFQSFDRIKLTPTVDRIEMGKENVTVVLNWDGQWQNGTGQPIYKEKGTTILNLKKSPAIRLAEFSGDYLFGAGSRSSRTSPSSRNPSNRLNP